MIYDLAIIGGGPAGAAAGVYAARKQLRTVLITKDWLGQSYVSEKIENWVGTVAISGLELTQNLEKHVKEYGKGIIDFKEGERCAQIQLSQNPPPLRGTPFKKGDSAAEIPLVKGVALCLPKSRGIFKITTDKGTYEARTILITSGSHRRKLDIPGAAQFENKGVVYCATCDGPLYSDQNVTVIGGGNAAFESAAQLMAYCRSVTLLNRSDQFKADPGTVEAVSRNPKVKIVTGAIPKEIKGDKFVTSIVYSDTKTNKDIEIPSTGIFVEIGSLPNTDFVKDILPLDSFNRIVVDPRNQRAKTKDGGSGIWAAGDCTDGLYHQNNIAAGDAVKAIEDIYLYVKAE